MPTVVLVDDEFWGLKHMEGMLSRCEGFHVLRSFTDSTEALDAICALRPDVVFTDLRMPVMNGIELIDRARAAGVDARYIIVSAHSDFEVAQEAIRKSMFDYLLKPIEQKHMDAVIGRLNAWFDEHAPVVHSVSAEKAVRYGSCFCLSVAADAPEKVLVGHLERLLNKRFRLERVEGGGRFGAAYALSADSEVQWRDFPPELGFVGVSRCCESFDAMDDMLAEAELARMGRFTFAANRQAADAQAYVALHYTENITLDGLAEHMHFSKTYLCDMFRSACDTTIISFLKQIRLGVACWYLSHSTMDVRQIARRVGFSNTTYFTRVFRSDMGMSPDEYRRCSRG